MITQAALAEQVRRARFARLLIIIACMTASSHMTRLMIMTFFGPPRWKDFSPPTAVITTRTNPRR